MRFPGRFELVESDPPLVLDGAHNPQAAGVLASAIAEAWPEADRRPVCVLGILRDKDAHGIVRELAAVVRDFIVTQPESPRALPAGELAAIVKGVTTHDPVVVSDPVAAVGRARQMAGEQGVVVTGSLYTVGQVRTGILL
jgi:dihydrofolate synthase/folylpolyglutamate synthase